MTRSAGNNWLLNIAINEYQDENIPNLSNPVLDAERFEAVLKKHYGFLEKRIIRCFNEDASREGIWEAFDRLLDELKETDSLIIYYAGHGRLDKRRNRGYWVPFNGKASRNYYSIENEWVINFIKDITCKHILLISDSCFAGSFFDATRDLIHEPLSDPLKAFDTPSRWVITSGRKQKVKDGQSGKGSPFSHFLVEELEKNTGNLFLSDLGNQVKKATHAHTETYQTPRSEALQIRGHKGGEFIFRKKSPHKKSLDPLQQDVSAWNEAKRANSQQAYESYLKNFPEGEFVELAQSRIAQLSVDSLKDKDIAAWKAAKEQDSLEGYLGYLREFPKGEFVLLAERAQERKRKAGNRQKEEQHRKEKIQAYVEEGEALFLEEDFEGAIECWEEALEIAKGAEKKSIEKKLAEAKEKQKPKSHPLLQELGIEMITIEGGSFMMGSVDGDVDEKPIHEVSLSTFQLAKTPITQQQWERIMKSNPSYFKSRMKKRLNNPVESVSWNDTQEFMQKLSQQTGQSLHLPSEAQWEFAARGGNLSKGYTYAGSNDPNEVAWYAKNAGNKTHPVGQKKPNELGLYDMSGNVWEWCQDRYGSSYYSNSPGQNPKGPDSGAGRVIRGGSWGDDASYLRVAARDWFYPGRRLDYLGFRPARTP
ncbi:MAG: SUMF1/EgtB/PvdO family nonheme iron enzyme [Bacteroidota bacterium]